MSGLLSAVFSRAVSAHVRGSLTDALRSLSDPAFACRVHAGIVAAFYGGGDAPERTPVSATSDGVAALRQPVSSAHRAALLVFLSACKPSLLSPHQLFTAGCLPVFSVYPDGLSKPDLPPSAPASSSSSSPSSTPGSDASSSAPDSSQDLSQFVSLRPTIVRNSSGPGSSSIKSLTAFASAFAPTDGSRAVRFRVPAGVLSRAFVRLPEDAQLAAGAFALATALGVVELRKPAFYASLLPRLDRIPAAVRDAVMLGVLSELSALSIEDPGFRGVLASAAFVPCPADGAQEAAGPGADASHAADADAASLERVEAAITLRRPTEVYDPLTPQLLSLLDTHLFPVVGPFRSPEVITALRSLGMQSTMSRCVSVPPLTSQPHVRSQPGFRCLCRHCSLCLTGPPS